jgi:predicted DCC family thiol-disulfide oxidoreductase YuxK
MGNSVTVSRNGNSLFTVVVDDTCPVVHRLVWLIRNWDRQGTFRFVASDTESGDRSELLDRLSETPWSLMLIDQDGNFWLGPEAIPFILKHLPSGKIAAVTYTIPGTMWVTRKLYHMVSRNRRRMLARSKQSKYKAA